MGSEIRPFKIHVNDADDLEDLKKRLRATRWPEPQTFLDWSQGGSTRSSFLLCPRDQDQSCRYRKEIR